MPLELKPTHPLVERSGRWSQSSSDTLTASWCGASLQFVFSGRALLIRPGKRTERKDPWNGGTPMLIWTITPEGSEDSEPFIVQSADAEPLKEIILVDGDLVSPMGDCLYFVRIMLVDWASVFEVEAIVVESVSWTMHLISVTLVIEWLALGGVHQALSLLALSSPEKGVIDR